MSYEKHIESVKALRDECAAVKNPTGAQRDVLSRATALLGRLEIAQAEIAAISKLQTELDASVEKAAKKK